MVGRNEDVPQLMRDAINAVLGGARAKNPDIQTFDDLHHHLASHRSTTMISVDYSKRRAISRFGRSSGTKIRGSMISLS